MQVTAVRQPYTGSQPFGQENGYTRHKQAQPNFDASTEGLSLLPQYIAPHLISADTEYAISQALEKLEAILGRGVTQIAVNPDGSINYVQLAQLMRAASAPYSHNNDPGHANSPKVLNLIS